MRDKNTSFYRGNTKVLVGFSAEGTSSDGAVALLEKLERKHKPIHHLSGHIPDRRDPLRTQIVTPPRFCISPGCDHGLPMVFKPFLVQMNNAG